MSQNVSSSAWLPIARLLRPQGRRGELLAEPLSDLPKLFTASKAVFLSSPGASEPSHPDAPVLLEDHWLPTGKNAGRIVLKLEGCDTISQAEVLAGSQLMIPAASLPALPPDTFFVRDLIGCRLFNADQLIGTIVDVEFATGPDGRTRLDDAAPLLAVARDEVESPSTDKVEPMLVPFIRAWLDDVDLPGRRILMHLPEGLVETFA